MVWRYAAGVLMGFQDDQAAIGASLDAELNDAGDLPHSALARLFARSRACFRNASLGQTSGALVWLASGDSQQALARPRRLFTPAPSALGFGLRGCVASIERTEDAVGAETGAGSSTS